jgi:hypothetical protein
VQAPPGGLRAAPRDCREREKHAENERKSSHKIAGVLMSAFNLPVAVNLARTLSAALICRGLKTRGGSYR